MFSNLDQAIAHFTEFDDLYNFIDFDNWSLAKFNGFYLYWHDPYDYKDKNMYNPGTDDYDDFYDGVEEATFQRKIEGGYFDYGGGC